MSDDLVKRLRDACRGGDGCKCTLSEAADRIEAMDGALTTERALTDGAHRRARAAEADRDAWKANAERLAEALRERDGGAHDPDCQTQLPGGRDSTSICRCGHVEAQDALAAHAKQVEASQ